MVQTTQKHYEELPEFIRKTINREIELATAEELGNAQKRIDERKGQIIAGVLLHVQKQINFDSMKNTLVISVKI